MQHHIFDKGPYIMGILNVTPDSFSDGGRFADVQKATDHALQMIEQGADIVDIGGESTRPGAAPVSIQEEIDRVIPVIETLKKGDTIISVDTRHAATMKAALAAGAKMVNDVTALNGDPDSMAMVAKSDVPVCLMHMQGEPQTMQENPSYDDVVQDVYKFLDCKITACEENGIDRSRIIVDPGIGFGKTMTHNLSLMAGIARFNDLGVAVLLGASRKSFIEKICPGTAVDQRLPGSLAAALWGLQNGVSIFRVHDVAETKQAFDVWQAIEKIV